MPTHLENGTNFLDEGCDVFLNESEIRMEEKTFKKRFREIPSSQFQNDDTMQLMKILHQKGLNGNPMA
jgi:hypothetical protein